MKEKKALSLKIEFESKSLKKMSKNLYNLKSA